MVKVTGPMSLVTRRLVKTLKKTKTNAYVKTSETLSKSRRGKTVMNLNKINRLAKDGETLLIQGKVLSVGELTKKNLTIVSDSISDSALKKIKDSKNTFMTIEELIKKNPKAKGVRILK